MISRAVGVGWSLVGEWFGSACSLAMRIRAQAEPVVRVFGLASPRRPHPAARAATPPAPRPEEQAREAKYYLAGERPAAPAAQSTAPVGLVDREPGDLPRGYGHDRLVLLARDPWWLFAYWELTPTSRIHALRSLGEEAEGAVEVLRVHDVTFIDFTGANAWSSFDIEPTPGTERWYINVWKPAAAYCVELGVRTPAGRFVSILRSNTVTTSRPQPSPDTTVRWVTLPAHGLPVAGGQSWEDAGHPYAGRDGRSPAPLAGSSDLHAPRPPVR